MRRRPQESKDVETWRKMGAALERRRVALGTSPAALARASKMDLSQLLKVLGGKCGVSVPSLNRLAEALGATASEILAEVFPPKGRRVTPRSTRSIEAREVHARTITRDGHRK